MIVSVFNNKGGVGKTTLLFHLACALAEQDKKVLMMDLDPQCSLTLNAIPEEAIEKLWAEEEPYIEDYRASKNAHPFIHDELMKKGRSIHFILKPLEDGLEGEITATPYHTLMSNLDIIPGRLSMQFFESFVAHRWSEAFTGSPHAIQSIASVRRVAEFYQKKYGYDFVLMDTSPSLGDLNRITIGLSDYFFIPCSTDVFSIYGIRNIGAALEKWRAEFKALSYLLPKSRKEFFAKTMVKLLGYTLYKAQKSGSSRNGLGIPQSHYLHATKIPGEIKRCIGPDFLADGTDICKNLGGRSIIYSHCSLPSGSQQCHVPMWRVPSMPNVVTKTTQGFRETQEMYHEFASDFLSRVKKAKKMATLNV